MKALQHQTCCADITNIFCVMFFQLNAPVYATAPATGHHVSLLIPSPHVSRSLDIARYPCSGRPCCSCIRANARRSRTRVCADAGRETHRPPLAAFASRGVKSHRPESVSTRRPTASAGKEPLQQKALAQDEVTEATSMDSATAADSVVDTTSTTPASPEAEVELIPGSVYDVEELRGVRVNVDENQSPVVEYLVHWKGGAPDTWEPSGNVAENLLRDYEDRWWKACREANEEAVKLMLGGGRRVLSQCVDKDRRSALHFAAATGNSRITRILCEAGSEVDLMDKDGYTPLHMATGYLHTPAVELLLQYSADPEVRDRQGRSVLDLAENLREQLPDDPSQAQRKFALQNCTEILTGTLFDELEPMQLLDSRSNEDGTQDFLVQWPDDTPDSWVNESMVAEDLQEDYKSNLEWAEAAAILRVVVRGDAREYLVKWSDSESYPDSWELEENLSPSLIAAWEAEQPAGSTGEMTSKVEGLKAVSGRGRTSSSKKRNARNAQSNSNGSRRDASTGSSDKNSSIDSTKDDTGPGGEQGAGVHSSPTESHTTAQAVTR